MSLSDAPWRCAFRHRSIAVMLIFSSILIMFLYYTTQGGTSAVLAAHMFQFISTHFLIVFYRPDSHRLYACNLYSKINTKEIIPSLLLTVSLYAPACSLWCYYRPMLFLVRHSNNITHKSLTVKGKLTHTHASKMLITFACRDAKNRLPKNATSARKNNYPN